MTGNRIGDEHAAWQAAQPIGIGDGNHFIINAVHNKSRLADALQPTTESAKTSVDMCMDGSDPTCRGNATARNHHLPG